MGKIDFILKCGTLAIRKIFVDFQKFIKSGLLEIAMKMKLDIITFLVATANFILLLFLFLYCKILYKDFAVFGFFYIYQNGRNAAILCILVVAFFVIANLFSILLRDKQNSKYVGLGYDVSLIDSVRMGQCAVSIFVNLLCVALTFDICLHGG